MRRCWPWKHEWVIVDRKNYWDQAGLWRRPWIRCEKCSCERFGRDSLHANPHKL